jgi:hypothetical protein
MMTFVTDPGVSTRPVGAANSTAPGTVTAAVASMITLPWSDVTSRPLFAPPTATVPVTRTSPALAAMLTGPAVVRASSTSMPPPACSCTAPAPLAATVATSSRPSAEIATSPPAVTAERTSSESSSLTVIPAPAVARSSSAFDRSVMRPPASRSRKLASRRAWLSMSVAASIVIVSSVAETTAADDSVTLPVRLLMRMFPTPLEPAVTLLPTVTVSPVSAMLPAVVRSGRFTASAPASSASAASVSTLESIVIVEPALLALSEICPRDLGTALTRRLPTVWSIVTPMSGTGPFGAPALTFVTL